MQQTSTLVLSTTLENNNKQQVPHLVEDHMPSEHIINNILNYSKSLDVKKSKLIGYTEVVYS